MGGRRAATSNRLLLPAHRDLLRLMRGFDPMASFAETVAETYDDALRGDEDETVACLQQLAGGGAVLELAIGTGRIALPWPRPACG